jgi:hypothetical protein
LKRQAARFRVFRYERRAEETWPRGDGTEVTVGAHVGEKKVKDIVWTVHVANKKANTFVLVAQHSVPSMEGRKLVSKRPPEDVKMLLSARALSAPSELEPLIDRPLEVFFPTESLIHALASIERRADIDRVHKLAQQQRLVPARIRARVLSSLKQMDSVL